jgi:hypothetical protein
MDPCNDIAEAIDRFYERTMHWPDFVLVGLREWARLQQVHSFGRPFARFSVFAACGAIPVRRHPTYYSMIAPVLEEMP